MLENKVSAVAAVDDNGAIQGNISVSDLRGLAASDLGSLILPVNLFLQVRLSNFPTVMVSTIPEIIRYFVGESQANNARHLLR